MSATIHVIGFMSRVPFSAAIAAVTPFMIPEIAIAPARTPKAVATPSMIGAITSKCSLKKFAKSDTAGAMISVKGWKNSVSKVRPMLPIASFTLS